MWPTFETHYYCRYHKGYVKQEDALFEFKTARRGIIKFKHPHCPEDHQKLRVIPRRRQYKSKFKEKVLAKA